MGETLENIITDEGGLVRQVYRCTADKRTWLIGRNVDDRPITQREWTALAWITKNSAVGEDPIKTWGESLFYEECCMVSDELKVYGVVFDKSGNTYCTIINMAYNMGTHRFNPRKWPKFFKAYADGDIREMAAQLKYSNPGVSDSRSLYFTQTKSRAERLYASLIEEADNG